MIPESLSNRVYFSALLPEVCPVTYSGLVEILDMYGVPHSLLEGTNLHIWKIPEAYEQIAKLMPHYKDRIEMLQLDYGFKHPIGTT